MFFISLYLLSHTFLLWLNPFADFAFIWYIHEHVREIENKHSFNY